MLRLEADTQMNLWETVLPKTMFELNEELAGVDELLGDEGIIALFLEKFAQKKGRPTVAIETYLRLMYLKFRYQLGYESLVEEVRDSLMWRTFCRIPLDGSVPDSTTLIKLTKKYGGATVDALNEALINRSVKDKVVRGRKLRVDTTAVESDIAYPTDAKLLANGIQMATKEVKKLVTGGDVKLMFRNRTRSVKRRLLEIAKYTKRRSKETVSEVRSITRKIMKVAGEVVAQAEEILESIEGAKAAKLSCILDATKKVIEQTAKLERQEHIENRVVSLADKDARPIRRGKRETEFGYKAILTETEERIIIDYECLIGNPSDETLLEDTLIRSKEKLGRAPRAVATDRGFGSEANDTICASLGIKRVSVPRKGKLSKKRKSYQKQSWFKRLQRFRAGGEATISLLKRKYGLKRTLLRGHSGAKIWVGWSILTYNLRRMTALQLIG